MKKIVFIITAVTCAFIVYAWSSEKVGHYQLSQFISPETCGGCHDEIYSQWKGSMHNLSLHDPIYTEVANAGLKGLTDKDEIAEAEHCQSCHTPVGYITGYPLKTSDNRAKIAEIARQGIQCDYCHSITGAYAVYNAKYKYNPGNGEEDPGVKRGPFKDSESDYHKSEYSEFHTKSEMCGTCHDVKHITTGVWLETTYQEWQKSPYKKQGVQCQDCHMYQRPGHPGTGSVARPKNPGTAAAGGVEREHIFTHYFVGGNMAIPAKEKNKTLVKMAEERLKNTLNIKIDPRLEGDKIVVRILNNGAGHEVPTGVANIRQVWLRVIVKDSKGKVIYRTGVTDRKGYLPDNSIVYGTVFGDGKGNPVDNLAKAREILKDRRLKPMQEMVEKIDAGKFNGKVTVEAAVLYSGFPQKAADSLKGLKGMKIPVVVMTEVKNEVER